VPLPAHQSWLGKPQIQQIFLEEYSVSDENDNKGQLSRRDFLKLTGSAAAVGAVGPAINKLPLINFVRQSNPLHIKLMTWFWEEPGRNTAWRTLVSDFHASQNDVRIDEAGWAFDQYTTNILVQVKSGKIDADLYTNTPDLAVRMLAAQQAAPIEDVLPKAGIQLSDLSKAHAFLQSNGHLYGLDCVTVMFGLLYNSGLLDAGKVTPPTSVDEWLAGATKLTNRPNQFGLYSPHVASAPESTWFTLQEWAMPYDGVWAKGKTPMVATDPVINGIKLFKKFYDAAFPQGTDDATATKMYGAGIIAEMLIVSAAVGAWKGTNPDVYPLLRSVPVPWPSHKTITRIHPIMVNANAPQTNQDAAKAFLSFLYAPKNYQKLLELALDVIPAYPAGIRPEYLASLKWVDGYNAGVPLTPPDVMGDFILYNSEFGNIVVAHLQEVLSANRPVEDAMGDAQKELEALGTRVFSS
jgi:ABC-type glycerol-3-phosphate transport system substrate-binding protein